MDEKIKRVSNILRIEYIALMALAMVFVVLFETNTIMEGACVGEEMLEFCLLALMQLLTIIAIPLALKLFKLKCVVLRLRNEKERALLFWGSTRNLLLFLPLLMNTVLYYLFVNVAFGYMAIILMLTTCFIYPSYRRSQTDLEK